MEALIESINNIGLIEPVVLMEIEKGKKYSICAGQRRLLAFKKLEKDKIPARVIAPVENRIAKLISLSENLQKKDINFMDKCRMVAELFNLYEGTKQEKLKRISHDLGVSRSAVVKWHQRGVIPDEVKVLIGEKRLSQQKAWQITAALLGNAEKIIEAAKFIAEENKTGPEQRNIIKAAKELGPDASLEEIKNRANELPPLITIKIHIEESAFNVLKGEKNKRGFERTEDLIVDIIDIFLENEDLK